MRNPIGVFFRFNLSSICWSLFIILLCGMPGSDFPDTVSWELLSFDKLVHAFLFLILVFLSIKSLKIQPAFKTIRYNSIKIALIWAVFLSCLTEILQGWLFVERQADIYDVLANLIGSMLGLLAFYIIYGKENTFRFISHY